MEHESHKEELDMNTKGELGGLLFATKMALGGAIGFEIFQYLGLAYTALGGSEGGSAVVSALLISGILNILTMLSYCELSAILPEEGGEYIYAKAAFGGFIAFSAGCVRWLSSVMGGALAALIFAEQLHRFFLPLFMQLTGISTAELILAPSPDMVLAIATIGIIAILTMVSVRGTKKLGTLVLILIIIIFAIFVLKGSLHLQETSDLKPPKEVLFGIENMPGFFLAMTLMLQPFLGMRALVAGVSRMEKPEKNVPKALILSTLLLMLVYGCVAYVAVSALSVNQNNDLIADEPSLLLNLAADKVILPDTIHVGAILMALVAIVACISAIRTSLMVQSSILRGMSRDRYLPKILLSDHRDFETPYTAIIASSLFIIAFSVFGVRLRRESLAYAAALFSILGFALVNLSVIALRKREPYRYRPFKIPLYPIPPIAGIVVSFGLFASRFLTTEVSAIDMHAVGFLLILVLLAYYLRMVGRDRLKVAVGGISLGIGTFG
ncbi:MAG: APC family permease, partial [Candidatus Aenigmatarchaeota archaeon]